MMICRIFQQFKIKKSKIFFSNHNRNAKKSSKFNDDTSQFGKSDNEGGDKKNKPK